MRMGAEVNLIHLSLGGPDHSIVVEGKRYRFEMHPQCGPVVLNGSGDEGRQPAARSPFWPAVSLWAQQGKQLDRNGDCIWKEEPKPVLEHIVGKHYRVVGWE